MRIITEFISGNGIFYEDWSDWLRKTSQELLRQSLNPILRCCWSLGEKYQQMATDLYSVAFGEVWSYLSDAQKIQIVKELSRIIENQACANIHQDILNLTEYMLHEREELKISFVTLNEIAEEAKAYAKAL